MTVLDAQGRVVSYTPAPGITPIVFPYDAQGRLAEERQGDAGIDVRLRRAESRHDAHGCGGPASRAFAYDDADRVTDHDAAERAGIPVRLRRQWQPHGSDHAGRADPRSSGTPRSISSRRIRRRATAATCAPSTPTAS